MLIVLESHARLKDNRSLHCRAEWLVYSKILLLKNTLNEHYVKVFRASG